MASSRRVSILGNSVVTSSLASTLRNRPDFEVIQLDTSSPEMLIRLREANPEAIILCEVATTPHDLIFRLLGEFPGLLVIGVDVEGSRMVALSGRQASLRTEGDLLDAIGQGWPQPCDCQLRPEGGGKQAASAGERSEV